MNKVEEVNLRKATLDDMSVLLKLEQKVLEAERPFNSTIKSTKTFYYDIKSLISSEQSNLLVAEVSGQIIGTGYAQIRESKQSLQHDFHSYLGFMYVNPDYRGKGINKIILEELISWSDVQGVSDCYLEVYSKNKTAIKAYEKVGFENLMTEMTLKMD